MNFVLEGDRFHQGHAKEHVEERRKALGPAIDTVEHTEAVANDPISGRGMDEVQRPGQISVQRVVGF